MPFYTFSCNGCGEKFEIKCTIAEKDGGAVVCPGCGANELDRIFEGFSVAVKGSAGQPAVGAPAGCPHAGPGGCPRGGCNLH